MDYRRSGVPRGGTQLTMGSVTSASRTVAGKGKCFICLLFAVVLYINYLQHISIYSVRDLNQIVSLFDFIFNLSKKSHNFDPRFNSLRISISLFVHTI